MVNPMRKSIKNGRFHRFVSMMVWKVMFLFLFACLGISNLYSWTGLCHKRLALVSAKIASSGRFLASLSGEHSDLSPDSSSDSLSFTSAFLKELAAGAIAPDRRGVGWLPPSYHGLTPFRIKGEKLRGKAHIAYKNIVNGILVPRENHKRWGFDAGRALHIIQDLCQPFHTGSGNDESLYHSLYEKQVEKHLESVMNKVSAKLSIDQPAIESYGMFSFGNDSFLHIPFKSADYGRSDFNELHRLCRLGVWNKGVEELTVRCFLRALRLGASFLRELESVISRNMHSSVNLFPETCLVAGSSLCGILFVLWMHFFIYCRE